MGKNGLLFLLLGITRLFPFINNVQRGVQNELGEVGSRFLLFY